MPVGPTSWAIVYVLPGTKFDTVPTWYQVGTASILVPGTTRLWPKTGFLPAKNLVHASIIASMGYAAFGGPTHLVSMHHVSCRYKTR